MKKLWAACLLCIVSGLLSPNVLASPVFGVPDFTEPSPSRDNCRIYYFRVNDPEPPLNVRSSREIRPDNVITTLPNRWIGTLISEKDGWFQIPVSDSKGGKGWIVANRTEYGCNHFSEPITQTPYTIPSSRLIGTGTHAYELELKKGQILVIRPEPPADEKTFRDWPSGVSGPGIPGRAEGFPNPYTQWWRKQGDKTGPEPSEWRWAVTQSGHYTIIYQSNYKGFSYGSSVVEVEGAGSDN